MSWSLVLLGVLLATTTTPTTAVTCHCNEGDCAVDGVCEADICLIGIIDEERRIVRKCGAVPYAFQRTPDEHTNFIGCARNVERYSAVCMCNANFCNTVTNFGATHRLVHS